MSIIKWQNKLKDKKIFENNYITLFGHVIGILSYNVLVQNLDPKFRDSNSFGLFYPIVIKFPAGDIAQW